MLTVIVISLIMAVKVKDKVNVRIFDIIQAVLNSAHPRSFQSWHWELFIAALFSCCLFCPSVCPQSTVTQMYIQPIAEDLSWYISFFVCVEKQHFSADKDKNQWGFWKKLQLFQITLMLIFTQRQFKHWIIYLFFVIINQFSQGFRHDSRIEYSQTVVFVFFRKHLLRSFRGCDCRLFAVTVSDFLCSFQTRTALMNSLHHLWRAEIILSLRVSLIFVQKSLFGSQVYTPITDITYLWRKHSYQI